MSEQTIEIEPSEGFSVSWTAILSNEEFVREEEPIANEPMSWQKLLIRLSEENLSIHVLQLHRGFTTITSLLGERCDGFFQAHEKRISIYGGQRSEYHLQGIGSVIGDNVFITWIDDNGGVWQDVRPLEIVRTHTTLKYKETQDGSNT
jgi:hypothetical protein